LIRTYTYDNRDLNLGFKEYHTSVGNTLLRQEAYAYDALGRRYQESVYKVVDGSNAGTTAQISRWYYDALDRVVREALAGSDLYTVTIYDAVGRATTDYWAYGGNSSSSASGSSGSPGPDPTDISQATVVEQIERSFDAADNRVGAAKRQRFDDATGVGALRYATGTQPRARVSYEALYPDAVGRLQAHAFYGTAASGGVAPVPPPPPPAGTLWPWSRPDLIPSGSDTVLVTRINYNSAALVETITFPTGRVDRATYDRMDRLTVLIENDESSSSSSSSSTGYATDTRTTRFAYTDDSWLKSLKSDNAATGQQTTQWDYGAIISETPSTVYSNRHVYQKKYPDTGGGTDLVSYKYNRQREMRWMKDQAGTEHTYLYDKLGRFISDEAGPFGTGINQDVKKLQYGYDRRGRLVRATSFDGSSAKVNEVVWDHNDFNQPITEFQAHGGAVNGSTPKVQYAYATGSANTIRPTGITSPNNTALTIAYNSAMASALSRPDALKEGATTLASFKYLGLETPVSLKYDAAGSAEWTMRNGSATGEAGDVYTGLDRFGRLVETLWKTTTATLVNTTYGRNRFGGVTWQRNDRAHAINPSTDENTRHDNFYWYDRLRQNYQHQRGNLAGTPPNYTGITNLQQTEVRSFDETGNWLSDYTTSPALSQTRTHNKANEIATISGLTAPVFDARGNMTTVPKPGSWTPNCTMAWDAWNRPVSFNDGSATSYKYDALHRRIVKARTTPSETRDYYYDNEWRAIEERVSSTVKAHYAWHPDDRWTLIRRKRSVSGTLDETLFVLRDNLDPAAVINASAAVQERFSYDAFGPVRFLDAAFVPRSGNVSSSDWNFLFHAEFRDVESGLYNYGYRYYHPNLGRWLSRDFIEEEGGLNLYAFVGNETVNERDLFGLRPPGVNPPRRPSPQRPSPQRPTPQAPAPSPQPSLNPHRNRNRNNHCPAKKPGCGKCQKKGDRVKDRGGNEWDVEGPNPYHPNLDCMRGRNNSTNNPPWQDLRGSQCCFKQDKDCKLENSGKHQGTYDYSPPLRDDGGVSIPGVIGHFLLDVLPHYFDNNYDPTPPENVHYNL
jgi:RHS repeat-associated protein